MSGYVLANVNWASEEERRAYVDLLGPSLDAHGGVAIAGSPDAHVLEGDWQPDGLLVLISFPTVEAALAWYDSEEYRPALEIRKRSASSRLLSLATDGMAGTAAAVHLDRDGLGAAGLPALLLCWLLLLGRWEGEAGRGGGAFGAGLHAEVVGELADDPQPVAVLAGPGGILWGSGLGFWCWAGRGGGWLAAVGHLAVQRSAVFGEEQPPVTGAVADGVGGEFMDGEDEVTGAGLGHPGLGGVGGHGRAQRIQRPCSEILGQHRGATCAGNIWPGGSCPVGCELLGCRRRAVGVSCHGRSPG